MNTTVTRHWPTKRETLERMGYGACCYECGCVDIDLLGIDDATEPRKLTPDEFKGNWPRYSHLMQPDASLLTYCDECYDGLSR